MLLVKKIIKIYYYIFLKIKLKFYKVQCGKNVRGNRVILTNNGTITLGDNISLNSYPSGELFVTIGNNCNINGTMIYCRKKVTIGSFCMFGPGVKIIDNDSHRVSIDRDERMKAPVSKDICIYDNVWIGSNSLILKGVTIGENAIVAAHSVVTKDIPKNTLFAGNPAKLIKYLQM